MPHTGCRCAPQGGVRGVGFIHWPGLAPELQGTANYDVVAVADWLPTFVEGVAALELEADTFRYPLDGVNQWQALTSHSAVPARGPTTGLVHEIGGDNGMSVSPLINVYLRLLAYSFPFLFFTSYCSRNIL